MEELTKNVERVVLAEEDTENYPANEVEDLFPLHFPTEYLDLHVGNQASDDDDQPILFEVPRAPVNADQYLKVKTDGNEGRDDDNNENPPIPVEASPSGENEPLLDSGNYVLVSIAQPTACDCRKRMDQLYLQWFDKMARLLASLR